MCCDVMCYVVWCWASIIQLLGDGLDLWKTASVLGYCLLPVVGLAGAGRRGERGEGGRVPGAGSASSTIVYLPLPLPLPLPSHVLHEQLLHMLTSLITSSLLPSSPSLRLSPSVCVNVSWFFTTLQRSPFS